MNYEVFIDGEKTGQAVVNTESITTAQALWRFFNPEQNPTFIEVKMAVPRMFQNCIMNMADLEPEG